MGYHHGIVQVLAERLFMAFEDRYGDSEITKIELRKYLTRHFQEHMKKNPDLGIIFEMEYKSFLNGHYPLTKQKKSKRKPEKDDLWQDHELYKVRVLGFLNEEDTKDNPLQVYYKCISDQVKMVCPYKQWHKRFFFVEAGE